MRVVHFHGADEEWDALVGGFEGSTFAHLSTWRHVIGDTLGHEPMRLVAVDEQGVCHGLLPLVRVRSRLFGDFLISMPFLSYGGPLGSDEAKRALSRDAVERAARLGVDLLELRVRDRLPVDLRVSERKVFVVKELPSSPEALWKDGLRSKVRSQVRRPMKEGMVKRFGLDLVGPFYDVYSRTMRDLGTPNLPRRFFEAIAERSPGRTVIGGIEHEGTMVAAGFGIEWRGELEMSWAGALREYSRMAPNMLLYWAFMEEAIRRECRAFNFGRCTPGSGTHRFKMQWGAQEHPLPWAQWSSSERWATPNPESRKFRLAVNVWSRLPIRFTNALGPVLARLLP